jgi:tetratricopeptide (TPR) repeat protein
MDMVRTNLSGLDMEQSLRAIMDIRAQLAFLSMDRPRLTRSLRGLEDGLAMFNRLGVRINLCLTICLLAETYFMAGQYEKGEQASLAAFNGNAVRELSMQFMALAEQQGTTVALMIGHRLMRMSLLTAGDIAEGRVHLDRANTLYDPAEHRPLATRFSVDPGVLNLGCRSWTLWLLGYPDAALRDDAAALKQALEMGQAATLMSALTMTSFTYICCGNYTTANAQSDETVAVADEKGAVQWKARGILNRGWVLALTGKASHAVQTITSGIAACRSTGATVWQPFYLSYLARAYAELGQFDDAWRCIGQAITTMETTKERWCEAEINRVAGEIALLSPEPGKTKAEAYFDRALAIARRQQAKSWELRAVRPAIFLLRSTAGSPKASTRSI